MKNPLEHLAGNLFCEETWQFFATHFDHCEKCRASIIEAVEQFPFFEMFLPSDFKQRLQNMKGPGDGK